MAGGGLKDASAKAFWTAHFPKSASVSFTEFSAALSREYALAKSDCQHIQEAMDINGDMSISLGEFDEFTAADGLDMALQKLMHTTKPPPRRTNKVDRSDPKVPWLVNYTPPKTRVSTWQPGRDQQREIQRHAWLKAALFAVALVGFVNFVWSFEGAKSLMVRLESLKVCFGLFSLLDFCGSCVTCFNYRNEATRMIEAGDERLLLIYRTGVGFYAQTLLKCNFLQFGGTTVTALALGQAPSWLAGTHVFSAFLLAYWLVFCSPGDVWFRLLRQGYLLVPIKVLWRPSVPATRICKSIHVSIDASIYVSTYIYVSVCVSTCVCVCVCVCVCIQVYTYKI